MWIMPDNINVSTPISGNTNVNRPNQMPKESVQVNVIDPTKVNQPNTNKQSEQNADLDLLFSRHSVFSTFINQLRQVPALNQTLQKIMFELFMRKDGLHMSDALPLSFEQLAASAEMEKTDIFKNLQFQNENRSKFSGELFDILRGLGKQENNGEFEVHLAKFLKAYDTVFSAPETMKEITSQLELLSDRLPNYYSRKLQPLTEELLTSGSSDAIDHNLTILKEKILPFLANYAASTKDSGEARDTINLLVHTLARMNAGSRADLVNKFVDLLDYCRYNLHLPANLYNRLQELFAEKLTDSGEMQGNIFFDSLMKSLSDGLKQSTSTVSQSLYKDACSALLLDNSVYMPFTHFFLPVSYHGQNMFTDIWIEKDSGNGRSKQEDNKRPTRVYLTFTVQGLGYLEMIIELLETKVSVHLNCPSALQDKDRVIQGDLSDIFSKSGLTPDEITLTYGGAPKVPEQILKKVFEWRNMVDVSV